MEHIKVVDTVLDLAEAHYISMKISAIHHALQTLNPMMHAIRHALVESIADLIIDLY